MTPPVQLYGPNKVAQQEVDRGRAKAEGNRDAFSCVHDIFLDVVVHFYFVYVNYSMIFLFLLFKKPSYTLSKFVETLCNQQTLALFAYHVVASQTAG